MVPEYRSGQGNRDVPAQGILDPRTQVHDGFAGFHGLFQGAAVSAGGATENITAWFSDGPAARDFKGVQGRIVDGGDPQVFINSKDPHRNTVEQTFQESWRSGTNTRFRADQFIQVEHGNLSRDSTLSTGKDRNLIKRGLYGIFTYVLPIFYRHIEPS
jgi:hypothetical protein